MRDVLLLGCILKMNFRLALDHQSVKLFQEPDKLDPCVNTNENLNG